MARTTLWGASHIIPPHHRSLAVNLCNCKHGMVSPMMVLSCSHNIVLIVFTGHRCQRL